MNLLTYLLTFRHLLTFITYLLTFRPLNSPDTSQAWPLNSPEEHRQNSLTSRLFRKNAIKIRVSVTLYMHSLCKLGFSVCTLCVFVLLHASLCFLVFSLYSLCLLYVLCTSMDTNSPKNMPASNLLTSQEKPGTSQAGPLNSPGTSPAGPLNSPEERLRGMEPPKVPHLSPPSENARKSGFSRPGDGLRNLLPPQALPRGE